MVATFACSLRRPQQYFSDMAGKKSKPRGRTISHELCDFSDDDISTGGIFELKSSSSEEAKSGNNS